MTSLLNNFDRIALTDDARMLLEKIQPTPEMVGFLRAEQRELLSSVLLKVRESLPPKERDAFQKLQLAQLQLSLDTIEPQDPDKNLLGYTMVDSDTLEIIGVQRSDESLQATADTK